LVKVGTDFPYFSATVSVNPETGVKDVVEEANIVTLGVVLSLTPQVSEDGWITLGIDPMVTDLVTTTTSSNGSTAPVVDVKQSSSMVRLKDREMVAISGLIQDKKIEEERGVPLLSEIPFLGSLFKWTYKSKVKKELVIFLTPRIL
jgi:MSHA biogenesis protein MshL